MVFIPVAAVIFMIWIVCSTFDAAKTVSMRADYLNYNKALELTHRYLDSELENELDWKLKRRQIDTRSTVQNFMGGDSIWFYYTDIQDEDKKAKLVLMAERGKLPFSFVCVGDYLQMSEDTLRGPVGKRITPQRSFEMNEEFVLRVEQYLKEEKSVPVSVYCRVDLPDGRKNVFIRVGALRERYGPGMTNSLTHFQFLHDGYRR